MDDVITTPQQTIDRDDLREGTVQTEAITAITPTFPEVIVLTPEERPGFTPRQKEYFSGQTLILVEDREDSPYSHLLFETGVWDLMEMVRSHLGVGSSSVVKMTATSISGLVTSPKLVGSEPIE